MATPSLSTPSFRNATTNNATAILAANSAKAKEWALMAITQFPDDIQTLIAEWITVELQMKEYKRQVLEIVNDKCDTPAGKKLVLTLGRDVRPDMADVLYKWADASSGSARRSDWNSLISGK